MNLWKTLVTTSFLMTCISANATYQRLATCSGVTEDRDRAIVTLYANVQNDSQGIVIVNLDGGRDFASDSKINWNATAEGYPRFYDNDFDLDIIVNMDKSTVDDILVENDYIQNLECKYTPKN